jgi:hypothetical protein
MRKPIQKHRRRKIARYKKALARTRNHTLANCGYSGVPDIDDQIDCSSIQVSRKAREKLSKTGFMMYSKNVRSPVLM